MLTSAASVHPSTGRTPAGWSPVPIAPGPTRRPGAQARGRTGASALAARDRGGQDRRALEPRPRGFGFFFSLGHSTVVVAIGAGIVVAEKTVFGAVSDNASGLERFGGLFGTVVSAAFLLLIGRQE